MNDPNWLLSTLAQSTAALVAIIGGFLVSRLVQLSSEKTGLRRRLAAANDELAQVAATYDRVHAERLAWNKETFFDDVVEALVSQGSDAEVESIFHDNIPYGSSTEELATYYDEIVDRVRTAIQNVGQHVKDGDHSDLTLADLESRGMMIPVHDEGIYDRIERQFAELLPDPPRTGHYIQHVMDQVLTSQMLFDTPDFDIAPDSRRFDELLREEQMLKARRDLLELEIERLTAAVEQIGSPSGVVPAVWILGAYALLGIVVPVCLMTIYPTKLPVWLAWVSVVFFVAGLVLVVAYIRWFARTLTIKDEQQPGQQSQ